MEEMTKENEINEIELYSKPYCIKDRCLCVVRQAANGKAYTERLCNFIPWISNEIMSDDGAVVTRRLCVHGIHADGRCLSEVEISSDELTTLNWVVEKWGADCIIDVGRNAKENIRYALQTTAVNAEKKNVYSVTGWKQIDGEWRYLMPGGEDITVRLVGKLKAYSMPEEYRLDDIARVRDMLESQLATKPVLYPLLAYTFLSPLNEFLRQAGCEPKFVFMLLGKTGTRKSTLAALFLSFFGRFNASELPLSFRDTANSIIMNTFALKDVLTCIDDFHPSGRKDEVALTSTAQSVMRAYGDRTGRANYEIIYV